jgi:small subunit ribosomal protein S14
MAALFRAKKLDLGCFVNNKIIRDHSKRKVFEENEVQRYATTRLHPSL